MDKGSQDDEQENNAAENFGGVFMAQNLAISAIAIALRESSPPVAERIANILQGSADSMRESPPMQPYVRQLDQWLKFLRGQSSTPLH